MLPPVSVSRVCVVAALMALAGCSGDELSRSFGLTRDAPDEFQVTTRAPLSMPPDLSLRPPSPGAARPQEQTAQQAAEAALAPQTALGGAPVGGDSPGQQALLKAAGPAAPGNIRAQVDSDAAKDAPQRSLTDTLMFWRSPPPPGTVLDPVKEAQRLRENAALGQSPVQGSTPIIQRKTPGLFEGLF